MARDVHLTVHLDPIPIAFRTGSTSVLREWEPYTTYELTRLQEALQDLAEHLGLILQDRSTRSSQLPLVSPSPVPAA